MKIALFLIGLLFLTFASQADSRGFPNWQDELRANLDRMHQRLKNEAEARQTRFEAAAKHRKEALEALSMRLAANAKRREEKMSALWERLEEDAKRREEESKAFWEKFAADAKKRKEEAEARRKKFQAELNELKQKCAKKGFSIDDVDYSNSVSYTINSIDSFRHIYVHTYNATTKKVSGSYYRVNEEDPAAEPVCGKLEIEPTSGDMSQKSVTDSRTIVIDGISFHQNNEQFVELGQKCAAKGFPNEIDVGARRMVSIMNIIDGVRHSYLQTYNSATKEVSGSYFRVDENGELTCGKLKIESTA